MVALACSSGATAVSSPGGHSSTKLMASSAVLSTQVAAGCAQGVGGIVIIRHGTPLACHASCPSRESTPNLRNNLLLLLALHLRKEHWLLLLLQQTHLVQCCQLAARRHPLLPMQGCIDKIRSGHCSSILLCSRSGRG